MKITILGEVISKKNSQRIVRYGGHSSIRPSKAYDKYQKSAIEQLQGLEWAGNYPVTMTMYLYRRSLRKFDYDNMLNAVQDCLVKAGVIDDDDMKHLVPIIAGWEKDDTKPRVEIVLEEYRERPKPWIKLT